jgi:hypothetical protein
MATKPKMTGPYKKAADEKKDAYLMKKAGLDKEQKEKFEKMDKAHGAKKKPKTLQEDKKIDKGIIKKIKSDEKRHEAREGKKGEKAEDKREKKAGKK